MHIARIRHLFYPYMPQDYFYELSSRQANAGHEVDLITWRKSSSCSEERVVEGFMIHRLSGPNLNSIGITRDYPYLFGLGSKLEALKPDIVHGESHLFLPTVQAQRKAKKLGVPCVVTVHGVLAERGFLANSAQHAYLRTVGLSTLRSATKVICLTHSDALEVEKLGCPSERITLIQNAIDTEFFKPDEGRSDNLVVWVGRFVKEKGVEYIIEATRKICRDISNVKVLLIGYGPLKARIVEMARNYGLLDKSIFVDGPLSREGVAKVLRKATIFVFPSLKEGMPISLLEAMACKLPVVVFDVPGIRELVEHGKNGLVVEAKNAEQLSQAILYLLKNRDQRIALGENSRHRVIENNSWETVLSALESVYCDAINGTN